MAKNHTPTLKVILFSASGIFIFLLLSTLFDISMGDNSAGRMLTLKIVIPALIAIGLVIGFQRLGIKVFKSM